MRIRNFTLADYDAAVRLWEDADGLGPVPREDVERKLARDPDLFVVTEDDGRVVAVAMGSYDGRRGWIFRLAVAPERRRDGIGRLLVEDLERRMLGRGITKVRLLVVAGNEGAHAFWGSLGYDRWDAVSLYGKDLTGSEDERC